MQLYTLIFLVGAVRNISLVVIYCQLILARSYKLSLQDRRTGLV